jgi:hypothetical protein
MITITKPLIELLAIKLYEHDHDSGYYPPPEGSAMTSWFKLCEEDRQIYRDFASGNSPFEDDSEDQK